MVYIPVSRISTGQSRIYSFRYNLHGGISVIVINKQEQPRREYFELVLMLKSIIFSVCGVYKKEVLTRSYR